MFSIDIFKRMAISLANLSLLRNGPTGVNEKWSGGVHLILNCDLDAAWSLQSDFLGLKKWAPTVSICKHVEGEYNGIGCLRYCRGSETIWVNERLLELDDANRYMSYRMEDNHFFFPNGFQGYVAKVQLEDAGEGKTCVKWTYEVDPVAFQCRESLSAYMTGFYTLNLQNLETGANKIVTAPTELSQKRYLTTTVDDTMSS